MITAIPNIKFPEIPNDIIKRSLKIRLEDSDSDVEYTVGSGVYTFKTIEELYPWIKSNICNDFSSAGIQIIEKGNFDVHIDGKSAEGTDRYFTLLYLIRSGGDPCTNFYRTDSDMIDEIKKNSYKPTEKQRVDKIASFKFVEKTWNLMNTRCLHSVEGIKSKRICVAINWHHPAPQSLIDMKLI